MWIGVEGRAANIDIASDDTVAHHGVSLRVHRWAGDSWVDTGIESGYIAIGPGGSVYSWLLDPESYNTRIVKVDRDGKRTFTPGNHAIKMVVDMSVGPDGSIWVINEEGIWRFNPSRNAWESKDGYGVSISAGNGVNAWHVGDGGTIHRWDGEWVKVDGAAIDISVSADEREIWRVSERTNDSGGNIYRLGDGGWEPKGGKAIKIAAGQKQIWHMDEWGGMYRWE